MRPGAPRPGNGRDVRSREDHDAVRDAARRLARERIAPTAAARDRDSAWPADELAMLASQGYMGMLVPERFGGSGLDLTSYCIAVEEISAADCGVGTICHVHNMTLHTIAQCGTESQKDRWLASGARGESIGAWMLTEPHAGSETSAFRTTARIEGSDYVLRGTKQFASNASRAGIALVLAVTDAAAGKKGMTVFAVDPHSPGYVVARVEEKLGQHTAHTAQVQLDGLRTSADCVIGAVGDGYRVALQGIATGRVAIAAQSVGVAQAALDASVRYASEREVAGKPIRELQAVAFTLAEMKMKVEVARQYYLHAAHLLDAGEPCIHEASIAKLYATQAAEEVCAEAVEVHGGYGYLRDFPVERYLRDVKVCKIYEGTANIQKLIISRSL
jgi:alkylation response protein AidB-like acyl-CoA dehydrogenase